MIILKHQARQTLPYKTLELWNATLGIFYIQRVNELEGQSYQWLRPGYSFTRSCMCIGMIAVKWSTLSPFLSFWEQAKTHLQTIGILICGYTSVHNSNIKWLCATATWLIAWVFIPLIFWFPYQQKLFWYIVKLYVCCVDAFRVIKMFHLGYVNKLPDDRACHWVHLPPNYDPFTCG